MLVSLCSLDSSCSSDQFEEPILEDVDELSDKPPEPIQINYFFDRTDSIKGFALDGKTYENEYTRAIDSVWKASNILSNSDTKIEYYEFGKNAPAKLSGTRSDLKKKDFYYVNDGKQDDKQPFGSVATFIKNKYANNEEMIQNSLNVVITDLYENNCETRYFHSLFKDAFDIGLSGAIFAVESEFDGNINDISSTYNNVNKRVYGRSTIFIFLIGDSNNVKKYGKKLNSDFKEKGLHYNEALFLIKSEFQVKSKIVPKPLAEIVTVDFNTSEYKDKYKYKTFNLVPIKLKKQFKNPISNTIEIIDAQVDAYLAQTSKSRYFIGIPIEETELAKIAKIEYSVDTSIYYFNGEKKLDNKEAFKFTPYEKVNVVKTASVQRTDADKEEVTEYKKLESLMQMYTFPNTDYIYITVDINNAELDSGYYKIMYDIKPKVKIPDWVEVKNASTSEDFQKSNSWGELIRVLNLKEVYQDIVDSFSKVNVYQGSFYIRKNKN
jgi:hypothetical protein